ncbi:hypothetical protein GYMLUDRAFT_237695 [Collybiopsis luxurians FD-317 M1]|nr:hypothetical protein GYMLUDRAFT_237695 [Collybiopsis luxurians FD-317 M1]
MDSSNDQVQQKDPANAASSSASSSTLNMSSPFLAGTGGNNMGMAGVMAALQSLGTSTKSPNVSDANQSANSNTDSSLGVEPAQGQGLLKEQIMLEQFKLAQLKQLQELQQQIFQQQAGMALINGSHTLDSQPRDHRGFHGLPTPGSSTELRPSQPFPVEFISPMQLNYNDIDTSTVLSLDIPTQSHSASHTPIFPPHDPAGLDIDINGFNPLTPSSATNLHFNSNIGFDLNANPNANNSAGTRSHEHYFAHRGTASAPAHIAFGNPYQNHNNHHSSHQHAMNMGMNGLNTTSMSSEPSSPLHSELDFDISPLTSPWLGAKVTGSASTTRAGNNGRLQAYGHHHPVQNNMRPTTQAGTKRPASPSDTDVGVDVGFAGGIGGDRSRKRQASASQSPGTMRPAVSPAIRPTSVSSSSGRPSHGSGSRSVNSTPLLRGTNPNSHSRDARARRGSVAMNSPLAIAMNGGSTGGFSGPLAGAGSSSNGSSMRGSMGTNNTTYSDGANGTGMNSSSIALVGDSPSPVDLSLTMPPPAAPASASAFGVGSNGTNEGAMPAPESLVPVTPASIMNLGGSLGGLGGSSIGIGQTQALPSNSNMTPMSVFSGSASTSGSSSTSTTTASTSSAGTAKGSSTKGASRSAKNNLDAGSPTVPAAGTRKSGRRAASTANTGGADSANSNTLKHILPAGGNPSSSSSTTNPSSMSVSVSRASTSAAASASSSSTSTIVPVKERKTSHKAAEQKRRDSLKTTFDDLRGLLPPIPLPTDDKSNSAGGVGDGTELDFIAVAKASMLPGALPPRGPPKAGGEGPNKAVSKLQLLICGNEYIRALKGRVERRDEEVERLRSEVRRLRAKLKESGLGEEEEEGGFGDDGDDAGSGGNGYVANKGGGPGLDLDRDLDAVEVMESMRGPDPDADDIMNGSGMLPEADEDVEE